ncbi:7250_t:CDS:2, partial [Ambispora leptoticha]
SDIIKFDELPILFGNFSQVSEETLWIKSWKNPFKISSAGLLSRDGENELYLMGKRSKSRYRTFWENITYASNVVDFSSSSASRAGQSGFAYALGLFEGQGSLGKSSLQSVFMHTEPTGLDKELAMKKACPKWRSTIARSTNHEMITYIKEKISPIANRITEKLGITPPLKPIHVDHIHRACGFEVAFFRNTTTWCSLLTDADLLTMEYFNDMHHYYLYSYGNRLNSLMACQLITSFVRTVDNGLAGKAKFKSVLRFAHAETIYFLMTLLNLNKDKHLLKAKDPQEKIASRKFRSSLIQPFAANIYFEIYKCSSLSSLTAINDNKKSRHHKRRRLLSIEDDYNYPNNDNDETFVQLLYNEQPTQIPGCEDDDNQNGHIQLFCPWSKFKKILNKYIGCDLEGICRIKKRAKSFIREKHFHFN